MALAAAATAATAVVPLVRDQEDGPDGSSQGGSLATTDNRPVVKFGLSLTLSDESRGQL
ncbi:hypothetical protein ACIQ6Y_32580 [Streptomyces sp. NPDC096205]|uniref:hypothetical protein n=1 Tax=Streptomyces sp. NPDC096205 TaxID=3366081 RepID=UPI00380BACF3